MTRTRPTERRVRSGRFLDPRVLARIDNLELVARTVVDGFFGGLHRSHHLGLSVNFAEHRPYMPGDDVRRVDWCVYARTDRFYVKEYEADSNTDLLLLLDLSASMDFSDGDRITKLDYGRFLAACLANLGHRQRDRLGLVTFDDGIVDYVPAAAKHYEAVLHTIDRVEAGDAGELASPMHRLTEAGSGRGIVAVISDLYEDPDEVLRALRGLRRRGNDVIVFHLLDPAEIDFDFDTPGNYRDMETGETLPVVPERMRAEYRELVQTHVDALEETLGRERIDYALFDTSRPLDFALYRYLSHRQKMSRVR